MLHEAALLGCASADRDTRDVQEPTLEPDGSSRLGGDVTLTESGREGRWSPSVSGREARDLPPDVERFEPTKAGGEGGAATGGRDEEVAQGGEDRDEALQPSW